MHKQLRALRVLDKAIARRHNEARKKSPSPTRVAELDRQCDEARQQFHAASKELDELQAQQKQNLEAKVQARGKSKRSLANMAPGSPVAESGATGSADDTATGTEPPARQAARMQ